MAPNASFEVGNTLMPLWNILLAAIIACFDDACVIPLTTAIL